MFKHRLEKPTYVFDDACIENFLRVHAIAFFQFLSTTYTYESMVGSGL